MPGQRTRRLQDIGELAFGDDLAAMHAGMRSDVEDVIGGADRIFVAAIHRDETSPHLSAFVVPLTADGRLSAKELIGGRAQLSADQTSYAECVHHLGLERGIEGSKARHTTISQYYARVGMPLPKPPVVEVPAPSLMDKAKTLDYGHKVAESVIAQLTPAWNAAKAKAGEFDQVKGQVSQLNSAAAKAGKRAKAEGKRADHYQDVAELFTPEEIEAARERRAELERVQADRERNLELLAERQRRIDALPGLRRKTAGAEHTFVNHALEAIERAGAMPTRWNGTRWKVLLRRRRWANTGKAHSRRQGPSASCRRTVRTLRAIPRWRRGRRSAGLCGRRSMRRIADKDAG